MHQGRIYSPLTGAHKRVIDIYDISLELKINIRPCFLWEKFNLARRMQKQGKRIYFFALKK